MEFIAALLVGTPRNILAVAFLFLAAYLYMRRSPSGQQRRPNSFLVPGCVWVAYAGWEWLVLVRTPEANIRVDLLIIWPTLIIISVWFSIRAFSRDINSR